jgi:signal transduction histidine kinase
MTPRGRRLGWAAAIVLGLVAEWSSGGLDEPGRAVLDLLTGWTVLGCGLVAWSRAPGSRTGALLAATGASWFAGNFSADLLFLYRGPLVHLLVAHPGGRTRTRLERGAVVGGYAAAVVPGAWASEPATLALCACLVAVVGLARARAVGALRRARTLSLLATGMVAGTLAAGAAARLAFPQGDADDAALAGLELALCAVALVLSHGAIARRWARPALTDLVVELGESRSGTLRDALARALGDPGLEVGYWVPETRGYVDAGGRDLALPGPGSGRSVTFVERDGRPLAALVGGQAMLEDPLLAEAVAAAARMAAANARLRATVRAQVAELRASRRRIVAAGAEQRRALAQRLHDGAQRDLGELGAILEQARSRATGPVLARVQRAETVLAGACEDLDALGRGLHPRALTEHGLAGALASLAEASPVPVELTVDHARLPADVEGVAYFVCSEAVANAVKHGGASHVAIEARVHGGRLRLLVRDDGTGGAAFRSGGGLRGLADRVEAVGGALTLESPPGKGTRVAADLPAG